MNSSVSIISGESLINMDDGFISMISNYVEKNNNVYFRVILLNNMEYACGPVNKKSDEYKQILIKKERIRRREANKYKPKYDSIKTSIGEIRIHQKKRKRYKIIKQNSRNAVIALGLSAVLGLSTSAILTKMYPDGDANEHIVNGVKNTIVNVINKLDDMRTADLMDENELFHYYSKIQMKDPSNPAAKNFFENYYGKGKSK